MLPCDAEVRGQLEEVFDRIRAAWGDLDFLLHSITFDAPCRAIDVGWRPTSTPRVIRAHAISPDRPEHARRAVSSSLMNSSKRLRRARRSITWSRLPTSEILQRFSLAMTRGGLPGRSFRSMEASAWKHELVADAAPARGSISRIGSGSSFLVGA